MHLGTYFLAGTLKCRCGSFVLSRDQNEVCNKQLMSFLHIAPVKNDCHWLCCGSEDVPKLEMADHDIEGWMTRRWQQFDG